MRNLNCQSTKRAMGPMLLMAVGCAALSLVMSSCSSTSTVQREAQRPEEDVPTATYSIVFVIHGDGDYLYHDTSGNEYSADEEALAGAKRVALQNPFAEVFIFHQKPRRHFLFLFPLHDGEFYYFRNGHLVANESYSRESEQERFDPELNLYGRFSAIKQYGKVTLFLYSGHEIPEFDVAGYDASYPDRMFTVDDLAVGLKGFTGDSGKLDLMVLSTCFGGTPYTIGALGSVARYIIASPDNLHLSYFDLSSLERLDLSLPHGDMDAFAERFARQAFDRLTREIQTAVSVAVYDMDRTVEYVRSVERKYDSSMVALKELTQSSMAMVERCDCADIPAYALPAMSEGVHVLYRAARFGRSKHMQSHSGWECWRERSDAPISETSEPK